MNHKKNAFVVDDDPVFANLISFHLQKLGFDVRCYHSGKPALLQLGGNLDLVVLDGDLGDNECGFQFLKQIKNKVPKVPVLFLSQKGQRESASKALSLGADYYIEKDQRLHDNLPGAIEYLDSEKKGAFTNTLLGFRRYIFSFYNF